MELRNTIDEFRKAIIFGKGKEGIQHVKITFTGTAPSGDITIEKETEQ